MTVDPGVTPELLCERAFDVLRWFGWSNNTKNTYHPNRDEPRNLLGALQEACDWSLDDYKECIETLATKLGVTEPDPDKRWPCLALSLVDWENAKGRSFEDVRHLLVS